jgi:8-oxo-dGTP pyrophosphatase MutT (NUDIX family)
MNIKELEQNLNKPLRQATIIFLMRDDEVLLAMKKRGFGKGRWNGVGGKQLPGEEIEQTAIREAAEEIEVIPTNLKLMAVIDFYFPLAPNDKDMNQQVWVYTTTEWKGEPRETEEMAPKWFKISEIPYKDMWSDDEIWLPQVMAGDRIRAKISFKENDAVDEFSLEKTD